MKYQIVVRKQKFAWPTRFDWYELHTVGPLRYFWVWVKGRFNKPKARL